MIRERVIATALRTLEHLTQGTSGNVSARIDGGFVVTPTGLPYEQLTPDDLVTMSLDGNVVGGRRAPSSEWRFHRDLYVDRPEFSAIVHVHSTFATSLACVRRAIPAFHYMVAVAGGVDVRCAAYATFGTEELSRNALAAMRGRKACLLANHGLLAAGRDPEDAFRVAHEIETLAKQYWHALQVGEPVVLDAAEMDVVLEKFRSYGQPR